MHEPTAVDWALGAVVGGLLLPLGIAWLAIEALGGHARDAVSHGELFLVGGNASLIGIGMVLADPTRMARVSTTLALLLILVPSYALSAVFVAASATGTSTSASVALNFGAVFAAAGILGSLAVVFWPRGAREL